MQAKLEKVGIYIFQTFTFINSFKFGHYNVKNRNIYFALTNGKTKLKSRILKAK